MRFTLTAASLLLASGLGQLPALPALRPVDEATQDVALTGVRTRLQEAVRARDAAAVAPLVSSTLVLDGMRTEPGLNRDRFIGDLAEPAFEYWTALDVALSHGGAFTTTKGAVEGRREFCAPYFVTRFPEAGRVPAEVLGENSPWVITAKDVAVYEKPDRRSRVLGRLSFAMVQAPGAERHDPVDYALVWKSIDLGDDREGFVRRDQIANPEGPRVCFANENGQWRISRLARNGTP